MGFLHRLSAALTFSVAMALGILAVPGPASAEKRVALVIGNDRYANLPTLQKAVNDAAAVGDTLAKLGFDVVRGRDLGRQGMVDKIAEFTARLEAGDTAVFFYAGHGVAIGNVNYLVPADAPAANVEARVRGASIAEAEIIAEIQAKGARVAVLVLDACRDNPFPRSGTRTVGNTRGLTGANPARGVFVLYSAGSGQTALDRLEKNDPNRNSVFTRVFVEQLAKPGIHIGDLAVEVREKVADIALRAKNDDGEPVPHEQTPAYYDQTIGGRVYLAGRAVGVEPVKPAAPARPAQDDAARVWAVTRDTTSVAVLEDFIRQFGATVYGSMARARLDELKKNKVAVAAPPVVPAVPPDTSPKPAVGVFPSARLYKPGESFKDCADCPEMVVVPAGSFTMGSPASEKERSGDEGPQRRVTFARPFAVGKFEATFAEWDACVADGGCNGYRPSDSGWGRGNRPAINVSWDDAKAYVGWLSRKAGKTYRLLSEAEWEYAARAGTTTPFSTGATITTDQANFDGNSTYNGSRKGQYRQKTEPVDSFAPNPWGLYQVHGNVWEWTEDCWNASYAGAPADGAAWTGGDCSGRVLRGGSWFNDPGFLRSAFRFRDTFDLRDDHLGFRVARTLLAP